MVVVGGCSVQDDWIQFLVEERRGANSVERAGEQTYVRGEEGGGHGRQLQAAAPVAPWISSTRGATSVIPAAVNTFCFLERGDFVRPPPRNPSSGGGPPGPRELGHR